MKIYNRIIIGLIAALILIILLLVFAIKGVAQDSVLLKVTKVGTIDGKVCMWTKPILDKKDTSTIQLLNGDRVLIRKQTFTFINDCSDKKKIGYTNWIAKKDLIIIKDEFTKNDF